MERLHNIVVEDRIANIENDVAEIKRAVIGDPKYRQKGVIERLEATEKKLLAIDLRTARIAGGVTIGIIIAKFIFKI